MLHEHHYDQPLKTQVTYFKSIRMMLLGSTNKKKKEKKKRKRRYIKYTPSGKWSRHYVQSEHGRVRRWKVKFICKLGKRVGGHLYTRLSAGSYSLCAPDSTSFRWCTPPLLSPQLFWQPALHSKTSRPHDTYHLIWPLTNDNVAYLTWRAWWQTISQN